MAFPSIYYFNSGYCLLLDEFLTHIFNEKMQPVWMAIMADSEI